jgi:TolA-binding protein
MKFIRIFLLLIGISLFELAYAQKTYNHEHSYNIYKDAYELFYKEKYAPAQQLFLKYIEHSSDRENIINAKYYAGVCAMELFNADAISMLSNVITSYPEHPKAKLAAFQLGRFFYRAKDNKNAIIYLEQVDPLSLTYDEADEYWFTKGYCYFKTDKFTESKNSFKNIKDKQNKYYDPANYYYGYVVYKEGLFDEALTHFTRISGSKTFGPLSQVYIAQIYFSRQQYEKVVAYADSITNKDVADDVAGIVGQSYFNLAQFDKAVPYLKSYNSNPPVALSNHDIYRLGYSHFATGDYPSAIQQFTRISDKKDTTAQYAYYHLAECYIKQEKKPEARLAFDRAYKLDVNQQITELSLFNYAKLSYELNQADALKEFVKFVNDYPESQYIDEARGVLGDLLMSTRNYKQAITVIESIKRPTQANNEAYQRVLYYYAEELYLNNDYAGANDYFKKSHKFDFDKKLYAQSYFWQAEIAYKQNKFKDAAELYRAFLKFENDIKFTRFYALAYYNIGYCYIKTSDYDKAVVEFNTFLETNHAQSSPELYTDAAMRVADCYLVSKKYELAIDNYNKIIDKKLNGSDYALYQKALIYGVLNESDNKINALQQIVNNHKSSPYIDDALYETGSVYLQMGNNTAAVASFDNIIKNYSKSSYIKKALLSKGLAYYNNNQDAEAIETFKVLAETYCNSDEAREAVSVVENIYVNKGETETYLTFLKSASCIVVSPSYQDSVTYEAAFKQYKNENCEKASKLFGDYISKFGGGFFILKANYYKAECDFKLKKFDDALINYEYVALYNRNDFTERATRQTALLYNTKKNYAKAFEYFSALERIAGNSDNLKVALTGLMTTSTQIHRIDTAAYYSIKYANSSFTTKEGLLTANLNIARYYMSKRDFDSAIIGWQYLIKETKNAYAAEAKYNMAYIQYINKDYKNSKKTIFEISEKYSSYTRWYESAFLLLADVYYAEKDYFQAKATLQSLIDNLDAGENQNLAMERLRKIIEDEESKEKMPAPKPEKEIEKL